eukprot:COSAG03_NODE_282_length_9474_cov_2.398720_8_plen_277_part_00
MANEYPQHTQNFHPGLPTSSSEVKLGASATNASFKISSRVSRDLQRRLPCPRHARCRYLRSHYVFFMDAARPGMVGLRFGTHTRTACQMYTKAFAPFLLRCVPPGFFAFTHVLDGCWPSHYHRSWKILGLEAHGSLHSADGSESPFANSRTANSRTANSRTLISSADVAGDANAAHTTVVPGSSARKDSYGRYIYEDVWRYMFTHPVNKLTTLLQRAAMHTFLVAVGCLNASKRLVADLDDVRLDRIVSGLRRHACSDVPFVEIALSTVAVVTTGA